MDQRTRVDPLQDLPPALTRQLLACVRTGLVVFDPSSVAYANPAAAAIFGREDGSMIGLPMAALVAPAYRSEMVRQTRRRLAGGAAQAYDVRGQRRDGSEFDTRVWGMSLALDGRRLFVVTFDDLTEVKDAWRRAAWQADMLARSEALCRSGSFEWRSPSSELVLSAGLRALVGCAEDDAAAVNLDCLPWVPEDQRQRVADIWHRARIGEPFEFEHDLLAADGQRLTVLHRGVLHAPLGGAGAEGTAVGVAMLKDITARRIAERRVQELINFDEITGLPNRANLLQQLDDLVYASPDAASGFSLLSIDIPRIAELASTMGFGAGDALAMALAARLSQLAVDGEHIAHVGGSEFTLHVEHAGDQGVEAGQVHSRALALKDALQQPITLSGSEIFPLCRIGLAVYPGDGTDAHVLLAAAQTARLDAAAVDGVARFRADCNGAVLRGLQLESALRHALTRGELRLLYQPQVCLRSGAIIGVEALLRWQSREFGAVSADEFIPVAERTGLIAAIGDWVLREACEQIVRWRDAGLPAVRVGVNISPVQFQLGDVALSIRRALQDTGASATSLGVELTESALMHDDERVAATLRALRASGIEIALDDFGTGYSSLSRLRSMPIDLLKIDRSFVSDVTAAPESASVTRSIINLAHGLQIPVLAEGVETEGQLNMLVANGCDRLQGYFFSRPVSADAVSEMLRAGQGLAAYLAPRQRHARSLLLVDDEPNVLTALRRLFRRDGYRIVSAASGSEALELLATTEVDVIISDQRMPGMTGVDFLRRAKALYPETMRMTLSGFTDLQSIIGAVNEGAVYKFLTKPWDDERLREHVAQAFSQKEMADVNRRLQGEVTTANAELATANADQAALNQRLALLLDQQKAQAQLMQASAGAARDMVAALPAAVFGLDPDGRLVYANPAALALVPSALVDLGSESVPALSACLSSLRLADPHRVGQRQLVTLQTRRHWAWLRPLPADDGERGELLVLLPCDGDGAAPAAVVESGVTGHA